MKRRLSAVVFALVVVAIVATVGSGGAAASSTGTSYLVVLKQGHATQALQAIRAAGGQVVHMNKVGVGTVRAVSPQFAATLRASGVVAGVAHNASFRQAATKLAAPPAERTRSRPRLPPVPRSTAFR